jgi:hypothetical protein
MSLKQTAKGGIGAVVIVAAIIIALALLAPGFATVLGRLIADLWVTVMAAVAGILGGFFGQ